MKHDFTDLSQAERFTEIHAKLEKLEEKLNTPKRTVVDIITHMQLLKELEKLNICGEAK